MSKKRVVLGLDIGIASIGWALVNLVEDDYDYETNEGQKSKKLRIVDGSIIDAGVRTFQPPHNKDKSLALIRGEKRRTRKTLRRKKQRMHHTVSLAKEYSLIEKTMSYKDAVSMMVPPVGSDKIQWSPWTLRKEAIERHVSGEDLFRILYHIAKHRGFSFLTKAEELGEESASKETGKVKAGLKATRDKLQASGFQTVGQMLANNMASGENVKIRNAKDDYSKAIHRNLLIDEVKLIFEKQKEFGNVLASDELLAAFLDKVLLAEKGINEKKLCKMMNNCEFTGELASPKEGYYNERFRLFNRLNTLELTGHTPLTVEQRDKIVELAYENKKVSFSKVRKSLNIDESLEFNLCSYREENPEFSKKLTCKVEKGQIVFDDKHKLSLIKIRTLDSSTGEVQKTTEYSEKYKNWMTEEFAKRAIKYGIPKVKNIEFSYSAIRNKLEIPSDYRFADISGYTQSAEELGSRGKYLAQFEKDCFVELKGYHKLKDCITKHCSQERWNQISQIPQKLESIAEALVYRKTDETRRLYMANAGIPADVIDAALLLNMKEVSSFSSEAIKELLIHIEKGLLFNDAREEVAKYDNRFKKREHDKKAILEPYDGDFKNNPVVMRAFSQVRKLVNAIVRKYSDQYTIDQINIEVGTDLAAGKKQKNRIMTGQKQYRDQKEEAREMCREYGLDPDKGQNLLRFRLASQQGSRCPYSGEAIDYSRIDEYEIDHIIPISRSFDDSINNKVLCTRRANQEKKNMIPYEYFQANRDLLLERKRNGEKGIHTWEEFIVNTQHTYGLPFIKKRKLLAFKFTEEEKDKFISRNLNDTRYAAKEVANYLRKYFDFSRSQRDDIPEVSRIQLRAGRVTSFLRYHWGLEKNREANDLHHALDAIVVACSTQGHVYLASMVAKNIETTGKAINGRLKKCNFEPWEEFRNDVLNKLDRVFISRMPRHKVTAEAHKDTVKSINDTSFTGRLQSINGGLCDMGTIVRTDFYKSPNGKFYAVPLYSQDFAANGSLPQYYLHKNDVPYEDWPKLPEDFTFCFSIFKDDLISYNKEMYYVSFVGGTRSKINLNKVDGSLFENGKDVKELSYRNANIEKYSVDMLGNYKKIEQEKRIGNEFEKKKMQQQG